MKILRLAALFWAIICFPHGVYRAEALSIIIDVEVYFQINQSELSTEESAKLNQVLPMFKKGPYDRPLKKLIIDGHADVSETNPKKLSLQRAEAVKVFFEKAGIPKGKLEVRGYGDTRPTAKSGDPKNRRVDFNYDVEWDAKP